MDIKLIIVIIVIIILLVILADYNKFVKLRNEVRKAKSGIDVYLNKRFDLIPNLVECVKGYMKHEEKVLEEITMLRSNIIKSKDLNLDEASKINNKLNSIIAISENYPELKSSLNFIELQKSLSKTESELQAARRIYNTEVTNYNTKVQSIPSNMIAALFGFKTEKLFEIEEYKKENIKIKL